MAFFFFLILQRKRGRIRRVIKLILKFKYLQEDKQLVLLIKSAKKDAIALTMHRVAFFFLKGIRKIEQGTDTYFPTDLRAIVEKTGLLSFL